MTLKLHFLFSRFLDIVTCKSTTGRPCDYPFPYKGNYYDTCINVDSGGNRWCYTNVTTKTWEYCDSFSCPPTNGELYEKS